MNFADRVKETTTATSAAVISLAGSAANFRSFASAFSVGDTNIPVSIDDGQGRWENGAYTLTNSTTLTRTAIHSSSNGGQATVFQAGTKDVCCTLTSAALESFSRTGAETLPAIENLASTYVILESDGAFRRILAAEFIAEVADGAPSISADAGFDIVLCAGQSNMVGSSSFAANIDVTDPRVFQFGGNSAEAATYQKIVTATDQLRHYEAAGSAVGPGCWFGKTLSGMIAQNRKILLVPTAKGGTKLVAHVKEWAPGNVLHENAIAQANAALAAAKIMYPSSRFAGTIWVQGESDGDYTASQSVYAAALKAMIAEFRTRINGAQNSWFVIGGLLPEGIATHSGYPAIAAAHSQVAQETAGVSYVPGVTGYAINDNLHYTAQGARIMGCRMAVAVPSAIANSPAGVKPVCGFASAEDTASNTIVLNASVAIDPTSLPVTTAFTTAGHTVSSIAVSGNRINLTVSPAFINGESARTLSYTKPASSGLRDLSGNLMDSFTGLSVYNRVQTSDITAPAPVSAAVSNTTPTVIEITMGETLASSTPPASAFSVSGGKAASSVSVAGTIVSVTVNSAYVNGDAITVTYVQPGANPRLQDAAGNLTASFGPYSVTNNIGAAATAPGAPVIGTLSGGDGSVSQAFSAPASNGGSAITGYTLTLYRADNNAVVTTANGTASPIAITGVPNGVAVYGKVKSTNGVGTGPESAASNNVTPAAATTTPLRYGDLQGFTESGTGPYTYASISGTYTTGPRGATSLLSMAGDGSVTIQLGNGEGKPMLFLKTGATTVGYTSLQYGLFANTSGYAKQGATGTTGATGIIPAASDLMRLTRSGSTIVADISKDAGSTWTVIHTWAGVAAGPMYAQLLAEKTGSVIAVGSTGFA